MPASLDEPVPRPLRRPGGRHRPLHLVQAAFANFERIGFTGRVHPVSRKGGMVHGLPAATTCAAYRRAGGCRAADGAGRRHRRSLRRHERRRHPQCRGADLGLRRDRRRGRGEAGGAAGGGAGAGRDAARPELPRLHQLRRPRADLDDPAAHAGDPGRQHRHRLAERRDRRLHRRLRPAPGDRPVLPGLHRQRGRRERRPRGRFPGGRPGHHGDRPVPRDGARRHAAGRRGTAGAGGGQADRRHQDRRQRNGGPRGRGAYRIPGRR